MVFSELWWQYQPGQQVNTKEGYVGTVTEVLDGPQAGNETYIVTLANGMGGGEYSSSELAPLGEPVEAALTELYSESDLLNTADKDYPEFGTILHDRLPLAESIPARDYLSGLASTASVEGIGEPEEPEEEEPISTEAGIVEWDMLRGKTSTPPDNWCRFRTDSQHCFYPKKLNVAATEQAGYPVWVPFDRGPCPRLSRKLQRQCPKGQPGPNASNRAMFREDEQGNQTTHFPMKRPDATVPWEQGGQRGGMPEPAYNNIVLNRPELFAALNKEADLTSDFLNANGGGFTIKRFLGTNLTSGYMVATDKTSEEVIPHAQFNRQAIDNYERNHSYLLNKPNNYLGAWLEDGNVYVDISTHVQDRDEAIRLGRASNQIAIWDIGNHEEIRLTGSLVGELDKSSYYNEQGHLIRILPDDATAAHLIMAARDESKGTEDNIFFDLGEVTDQLKNLPEDAQDAYRAHPGPFPHSPWE